MTAHDALGYIGISVFALIGALIVILLISLLIRMIFSVWESF